MNLFKGEASEMLLSKWSNYYHCNAKILRNIVKCALPLWKKTCEQSRILNMKGLMETQKLKCLKNEKRFQGNTSYRRAYN